MYNVVYDVERIGDIQVIQKPQLYICVMLSQSGLVKIGKTTNVKHRLHQLSGSNSRGDKIISVYVSEPTYLQSIEKLLHEYYGKNRIEGTEWFTNLDFSQVCSKVF